ncbi:MAG: RagB/SusD family nutrient uptake outer membrane protein [Paludibacter sp.]|nr:RagB/SusD family nutrient uptake outer membrane protein [Paludibacter sp.]
MKIKQNIWFASFVGAGLLLMASCTDSYENFPVDQFTEEYVFSKTDSMGVQALNLLNSTYSLLDNGHNGIGGDYLDAASDDAISINQNDPDVYKLAIGRFTANSRVNSHMGWGKYYEGIRKANIIINNIDVVPFKNTFTNFNGEQKKLNHTVKAEARFLRTYFYFELVKRYGAVPLLMDSVYKLGDDMELPRNTFEECISYMVDELDSIKYDLRSVSMPDAAVYGHAATIEAAMALKSRILLYAASPLFNENPVSTDDPAQKALVGYESYNAERWKAAADAAKEFMNTFGPTGRKTVDLAKNQMGIFLSFYSPSVNPEMIFFRQGGQSKEVETKNGPLGFSGNSIGNGRTNPTQNLVDAFPMKDGKPVGESTLYPFNPQKPYDNRDPRLSLAVLYNGSKWLGRVLETYRGGANNPTNSAEYTRTSYYMRKFMGNFSNATEYSNGYHLWVIFRYAEILLNYAEAQNEYLDAPSQEVYDALIQLRKRVAIPAGTDRLYGLKANMTKEEMREAIQNERRIEMAFEEQRYWDIRRWRIAEDVFRNPLKGMSIVKNLTSVVYTEVDVLTVNFEERRYLYPLPYSEVIKNSRMIQNPGW